MPETERRERQRQNFTHVTIHTAQAWADTFVSELNDTHVEAELRCKRIPPQLDPLNVIDPFTAARHRLIILAWFSFVHLYIYDLSHSFTCNFWTTKAQNTFYDFLTLILGIQCYTDYAK
jgi:hypothetical protein